MRRLLLIVPLVLGLAGCTGTRVGDLLTVATTTIANPVGTVDIYRVENVYAAALQGAKSYRDYCWSRSYAAITADPVMRSVCQKRRSVVRVMQSARAKAGSALRDARAFIANNPTLSAAAVISAAWTAVTNFQNAVPRTN